MMNLVTIEEYNTVKVACLEDRVYKTIEKAFVDRLGEKLGKKLMMKFMEKSLRELSLQSYVDVLSLINII